MTIQQFGDEVSAGNSISFVLTKDSKILSYGFNTHGSLGLGDNIHRYSPILIPNLSNVSKISTGEYHSLVLLQNRTVVTFGYNNAGQLGDGTETNRNSPVPLKSNNFDILSVSAGKYHSMILKSTGKVYLFGYNAQYQLGEGTNSNRNIPIYLPHDNNNIVKIFAKYLMSFVLKSNGHLYGFGYRFYGQLGTGPSNEPEKIPIRVSPYQGILEVVSGSYSTLLLQSNFKCFGKNVSDSLICSGRGVCIEHDFCQCENGYFGMECEIANCYGKNSTDSTVCSANGKCTHNNYCSCNVGYDGNECEYFYHNIEHNIVYGFGKNTYGEIGDNTTIPRYLPAKMKFENHLIDRIYSGFYTNGVLKNFSRAFTMGYNNFGQLGNGNSTDSKFSTYFLENENVKSMAMGYDHTLITKIDGTVFSSGRNHVGQLGIGPSLIFTTNFQQIFNNAHESVAGAYHSMIISNNSTVFSFGLNDYGQLGVGDQINKIYPTKIELLCNVSKISAGNSHTLVLLQNKTVVSFGYNLYGQLGDGSTITKASPVALSLNNMDIISVATGNDHSIILNSNGYVFLFGRNVYGQIGDGTTTNRLIPTILPYSNSKILKIAAGGHSTFILKSNGTLFGFGRNFDGELGVGTAYSSQKIPIVSANSINGIIDVAVSEQTTLILQSQFTCFGKNVSDSLICFGRGICIEHDVCQCENGYFGNECDKGIFNCFGINSTDPSVCSENGQCVDDNQCLCNAGYVGLNCNLFVCNGKNSSDADVCSNNGNCTAPNTCNCSFGYSGDDCQSFNCSSLSSNHPNVCNSRGTCVSPEKCICQASSGVNCEILDFSVCYGKYSNDSTVCSSNGNCSSNDNCTCFFGYYGKECGNYDCFGVEKNGTNVCSGNGNCTKLDTCMCNNRFVGSNCESPICFGINSTNPNVCSENGICSNYNRCVCKEGFSGNSCENTDYQNSGDSSCAAFGNDLIFYKRHDKSFIIEPTVCQKSGWSGFAVHQKNGVSTSMFLSVSWISNDDTIKIGEMNNHNAKIMKKTSTGIIIPAQKPLSEHQFQSKQRYKIIVDEKLIKNYDYISIVCGNGKKKSLYLKLFLFIKFIASTKVSFIFIITFWTLSTLFDFSILGMFSPSLVCSSKKSTSIYAIHLIINLTFGILLFVIGIIDIVSNMIKYFQVLKIRKTYKKYAWIFVFRDQFVDFYFKSDPFFFRMEQIIAFFILICYFLFEMINLNVLIFGTENGFYFYFGKFFSTIGRSVITYSFAFYQFVLPLVMSIIILSIQHLKSLKYKKFADALKIIEINDLERFLRNPEFFDLFLEFSKIEWSQENVLAYREISIFNKLKSKEKKQKMAFDIYNMYLNGDYSPLEINIDLKTCKDLFKLINDETFHFDDTTFEDVVKNLQINLSDTWSRFILTDQFLNYEKNTKIQQKELDDL
eukprot:gene5553-9371_t